MIFLCSEVPIACACCGKSLQFDTFGREDFMMGASSRCSCGALFQHVPTDSIIEYAGRHGDLARYA